MEASVTLLASSNEMEAENKLLREKIQKDREYFEANIDTLKTEEFQRRAALLAKNKDESEKARAFREDILKEIEVKDTEIKKLRERNAKLEMLMKKAVKIMQNP